MSETVKQSKVSGVSWIQAVEPLLKEGHTFRFSPQGSSMFPFIMPGRDSVLVGRADPGSLKRGDIVLYERPDRSLIVHRICRKRKGSFYIIGDNEIDLEGPVYPEQIKAVAVEIYRNGREISCDDLRYRILSEIWLWLRPLRPLIVKIRKKIYKKYGY